MRVLPLFAALAVTSAATAQVAGPPNVPRSPAPPPFVGSVGPAGPGLWREMQDVRDRIADGRDTRQLTRREARGLRRQSRYVDDLAERYGRDGLSEAEARELDVRARVLRDETMARRSGARPPAPPRR